MPKEIIKIEKPPIEAKEKLAKEAAIESGGKMPDVKIPSFQEMNELEREIAKLRAKIKEKELPGNEYRISQLREEVGDLEKEFELKTKIRAKAAKEATEKLVPSKVEVAALEKKEKVKKEVQKEPSVIPADAEALVGKKAKEGKKVEFSPDEKVEAGFREFKIDPSDLEKIEGFKELSYGQQLLVLENLSQLTFGRIQKEAQKKYKEETAKANWLSNVWNTISKEFKITEYKKATAEEIREGGIKAHGEILEQLTKGTLEYGPDVIEKEGKLEIQYASGLEKLSDKEKVQVEVFNNIASEFSKIPAKWSMDTASNLERERYLAVKKEYEKAKENILNIKKERDGDEKAALYMGDIENKLRTNRYLNTNPEIERELQSIESQNAWREAIRRSVITERGLYFAGGWALRSAAIGMLGVIGAPLVAGAAGSYFGYKRGKETIKEKAEGELEGVKEKTKLARNVVDATALSLKIDFLVNKINIEKNEAKRKKLLESLRVRIKYSQDKLGEGRVNFGGIKEKIPNQYNLADKLSFGSTFVAAELNKKTKSELEKKLDSLLGLRKRKITKARRWYLAKKIFYGASFGAAFATAGYYIRDVFSVVEEVPKTGAGAVQEEFPEGVPAETKALIPLDVKEKFGHLLSEELIMQNTTLAGIADAELSPQFDIKPTAVEFSSKGAIQTFINLKESLGVQYPDLDRAPESVREIIEGDPTKLAIKYGFYEPGAENESAMIWKGSTLFIDEKGDLVFNDVRTGQMSELNLGEKYEGEMFAAGAEAPPEELAPSEVERAVAGVMELTAEQQKILYHDIYITPEDFDSTRNIDASGFIKLYHEGGLKPEFAELGHYINEVSIALHISPESGESVESFLERIGRITGYNIIETPEELAATEATKVPTAADIPAEALSNAEAIIGEEVVAPELAEQVTNRTDEMLKAIFGRNLNDWEDIKGDSVSEFMKTFESEPKKEYFILGAEIEDAKNRHLISPLPGEKVASFFKRLITKDIETGSEPYILLS